MTEVILNERNAIAVQSFLEPEGLTVEFGKNSRCYALGLEANRPG